jgi:membrane-bound lytic murein transglycosylase D
LEGLEADPPLEYDQLELSSATNLLLAADITERPVSDIRDLNPALLRSVAPPGYSLRVPRGTAAEVQAALEMIPAGQRAAWRMHRVTNGDTLASIARRYRTSPGGISKANGIDADELASGSFLVIPARLQPESSGATKKPVKRAGRKSSPGAKTVARSRKTPSRNTRTVASRGMSSQTARAIAR